MAEKKSKIGQSGGGKILNHGHYAENIFFDNFVFDGNKQGSKEAYLAPIPDLCRILFSEEVLKF